MRAPVLLVFLMLSGWHLAIAEPMTDFGPAVAPAEDPPVLVAEATEGTQSAEVTPADPADGAKEDDYLVTATVDSYYAYALSNPAGTALAGRAVDNVAGTFQIPMVQLDVQKPGDHDFGFGAKIQAGIPFDNNIATFLHYMGEPDRSTRFVQELYLRYRAGHTKEVDIDLGKFNTCLGFEVNEARDNYNYSRSFSYAYGVPAFHFGVRAAYPWSDEFTTLVTLGNGWDRITNGGFVNGPHCLGISNTWTKDEWTAIANWMGSAEPTGFRNTIDGSLIWDSDDGDINLAANLVYGWDPNGGAPATWLGTAGYARYNWDDDSVAVRGEVFQDPQGFRTGTANNTVFGITGTYEHRFGHSLTARAEWRTDFSNQAFFPRNGVAGAGNVQNTFTVGLITYLN